MNNQKKRWTLFIVIIGICLLVVGCKQKPTSLELNKDIGTVEQLSFSISGKVNGKKIPYFYYQVEDGHGFLATERVELNKNRNFDKIITISPPSNGYGQIVFYYDSEQQDVFNVESQTLQKIGTVDLVFDPSLIVRNVNEHADEIAFWTSAASWTEADGHFRTDLSVSLLLYREDQLEDGILYIEGQKLIYARMTTEGMIQQDLLTFKGPTSYRFWRNGNVILMGSNDKSANEGRNGHWYAVQLPVRTSPHSENALIEELDPIYFNANDVLTMVLVDEPQLFFLTVVNATSFSEFVYRPGSRLMLTVNTTFEEHYNMGAGEAYRARKPEKQEKPLTFAKQLSFPFKHEGTVHTFEDNRGTIVYYHTSSWNLVWRYVDHQTIDFKLFHDEHGQSYPLGKFTAPSGKTIMSFPNWGSHSHFTDQELLWEDGWKMLNMSAFYLLSRENLQTLNIYYDRSVDEYVAVHKVFPLHGAEHTGDISGSLLQFQVNGSTRQLSLYDAIHYEQANKGEKTYSLDELWVTESDKVSVNDVDVASLQQEWVAESWEQMIEVALPSSLFRWDVGGNFEDEPEALRQLNQALDRECLRGCGDYSLEIIYREFANEWYALAGNSLYKAEDEKLIKLGDWPVQLAPTYMYGKGGSTYTAQDFIQVDDHWFVADTFGGRIVKLDTDGTLIAEYLLPYPEKMILKDNGQLIVRDVQGDTTLDQELRLVQRSARSYDSVPEEEIEPVSLRPSFVYEDPDQGLIWAYSYSQYRLIQFDPKNNKVRSFYIGGQYNNAAEVKIVPFRQNIILLFDHRALLFSKDGKWLDSFEYPRDSIFDDLVHGEGTVYVDEQQGRIHMIQGFRILQIDPIAKHIDIVFEQINANMGNLTFYNGKLIFTKSHGLIYESDQYPAELIVYDVRTKRHKRWRIDMGYISNHIEDDHVILWRYEPDGYGKKLWGRIPISNL